MQAGGPPQLYQPYRDQNTNTNRIWDRRGHSLRQTFVARPRDDSVFQRNSVSLSPSRGLGLGIGHSLSNTTSTHSLYELDNVSTASSEQVVPSTFTIDGIDPKIERCQSADDTLQTVNSHSRKLSLPSPTKYQDHLSYQNELFFPHMREIAKSRANIYARGPRFSPTESTVRTTRSQSASTSRQSFDGHLGIPPVSQYSPKSVRSLPDTDNLFSNVDRLISSKRGLYKRSNVNMSPSLSSDAKSQRSSMNTLVELDSRSSIVRTPELPGHEVFPTLHTPELPIVEPHITLRTPDLVVDQTYERHLETPELPADDSQTALETQSFSSQETRSIRRAQVLADYGDPIFNTLPGEAFPINSQSLYPVEENFPRNESVDLDTIPEVDQQSETVAEAEAEAKLERERPSIPPPILPDPDLLPWFAGYVARRDILAAQTRS